MLTSTLTSVRRPVQDRPTSRPKMLVIHYLQKSSSRRSTIWYGRLGSILGLALVIILSHLLRHISM
jgi:hypothetical protein